MPERSFPRRAVLALMTASAVAGLALPAQAQTSEERVIQRLASEGYTEIEVRRTLLGRIRLRAARPDGTEREIVLNPRSGEILRDYIDYGDQQEREDDADREDEDDREETDDRDGEDDRDDDRDDNRDDDDDDDRDDDSDDDDGDDDSGDDGGDDD